MTPPAPPQTSPRKPPVPAVPRAVSLQVIPRATDPQATYGNAAVTREATQKNGAPKEPTAEQLHPNWPKQKLNWSGWDLLMYPLAGDVWKDLRRTMTGNEKKEFGLTGTESAALSVLPLGVGYAAGGLGGHSDVGQWLDYASFLQKELSPGSNVLLDPLSLVLGRRVDKYLASELFAARWKSHVAGLLPLALLGQGLYSGYRAAVKPSAPHGEMVPEEWSRHIAQYWTTWANVILGPRLAAPDLFDFGSHRLPLHRLYGESPLDQVKPPSGLKISGNRGAEEGEGGSLFQFSATLNLPRFAASRLLPEFRKKDVDDPEKYSDAQAAVSVSYEALDPTRSMRATGMLPRKSLKTSAIFGSTQDLAYLGLATRMRPDLDNQPSALFATAGYGHRSRTSALRGIGATLTYMNVKETDPFAPGLESGNPTAVEAWRFSPFVKLEFGRHNKLNAELMFSLVTGSRETLGLSELSAGLAYTHMGNRSPGQLPMFKLDVSGSVRRLDSFNPESKILKGVKITGSVDQLFGGVLILTGAAGISRARAAQSDAVLTVELPWTLLFTLGYLFGTKSQP